jgi:hypothetical protein
MKTSSIPEHVLYAGKPVHLEQTPEGLRVRVFDSMTKKFVTDFSYFSRILYDRDNLVETVDSATFDRAVKSCTAVSHLPKSKKPVTKRVLIKAKKVK